MAAEIDLKPHFYLAPIGKSEQFTSPSSGGGKSEIPERNRQQHSSTLLEQLNQVITRQSELKNYVDKKKDSIGRPRDNRKLLYMVNNSNLSVR